MKRLFKRTLNRILNDDGVDITPKALSNWNSDDPMEDLENLLPAVSSVKKKVFGNKISASVTSVSSSTLKSDNENPFHQTLYVSGALLSDELQIILTESDTIWLFDLPDVNMTTFSESIEEVNRRNEAHTRLSEKASERFMERGMTTLQANLKTKSIQTDDLIFKDMETQVSPHFFYDEEFNKEAEKETQLTSKRLNTQNSHTSISTTTLRSELQAGVRKATNSDVGEEKFTSTKYFNYLCTIAERLLQYNQFYIPMAVYKKVPLLSDESHLGHEAMQDEGQANMTIAAMPLSSFTSNRGTIEERTKTPQFKELRRISSTLVYLNPLWKYKCILNKELKLMEFSVTSISFNHKNPDLMAAAYSQLDYGLQKEGWVCCWCIKNFEYPERIIKVDSGATALAFSCTKPYMLAIGLFNGTLLFYNVSTNPPILLHSSFTIAESHRKPVFALEWMEKNGYEMVLSTSTDGKVLQWVFNNELQCIEILELKLVGKHEKSSKKSSNTVNSGGLCLNCNPERSEIYLIGTDNGLIHRCSAIHANQFFKTYTGHIAPVYKVKWCPYELNLFASCGADMSVKIWDRERSEPLLDLLPINPPNSPALDLTWCGDRKGALVCVFGTELQIWDLFSSKLDPAFIYHIDDTYTSSLTAILYSQLSESIYVGDCLGDISIFRIMWLNEVPPNANLYETLQN